MAKRITFIFLIIALVSVQKGTTLRCFHCSSETNEQCIDPELDLQLALDCNDKLVAITNFRISTAIGGGTGWAEPTGKHSRDKCLKIIIHVSAENPETNQNQTEPQTSQTSQENLIEVDSDTRAEEEMFSDIFIRGCLNEDENPSQICEKIHNKAQTGVDIKYCSTCDGDECNGSTRISSLSVLPSNFLIVFPLYLLLN